MSSVPPNMPPGSPPPYDPKTQWRVYREQQRAAWHAQRDAWRAQKHAWKANYMGPYGPRVPSVVGPVILIVVGIVALLVMTGHINADSFWNWYGQWWPLLLIGAGLALMGEWALDMRRKTPVRRGGSFIGILILLAIVGAFAAAHNHFWGPWGGDDDFFNTFGQPEHDHDQQVLNTQVPANALIDIENPRGDVSITASDQNNVTVDAHEVAYANSDSSAKRIFDSEAADVKVSGSSVSIKTGNESRGRVNLTVSVPKTAKVTVNAGKGDVTASGLGAGIDVTAPHGDVHLSSITGQVLAHLAKGEFAAHDVQGDVNGDGPCDDVTLSDIKGNVMLNCDIFNQMHMEHITGQVHFRTSKTDVQLAGLDGDLTLSDEALEVTEAKGPAHVVTHSRDVDLNQITGDSYIEDRDGTINVEPAGTYGVEAKNAKGDVEVTLPPDASATVDGRTHNGDVLTDFALSVTGEEDKTVTGKIGSGTARIVLSTDNGDLHIKKGSAAGAAASATASAPSTAGAGSGKHLKSKNALPQQPVAQ
jgi:DUF4097 and DUF4098 domain-containing protein YvlB